MDAPCFSVTSVCGAGIGVIARIRARVCLARKTRKHILPVFDVTAGRLRRAPWGNGGFYGRIAHLAGGIDFRKVGDTELFQWTEGKRHTRSCTWFAPVKGAGIGVEYTFPRSTKTFSRRIACVIDRTEIPILARSARGHGFKDAPSGEQVADIQGAWVAVVADNAFGGATHVAKAL